MITPPGSMLAMVVGLVPRLAVTIAQLPPESIGSQVAEWGSITVVSVAFLYFTWGFANNRIVSRDSERAEEAARQLAATAQKQTERALALTSEALDQKRAQIEMTDRLMGWLEAGRHG